jgi:hypothetical protein
MRSYQVAIHVVTPVFMLRLRSRDAQHERDAPAALSLPVRPARRRGSGKVEGATAAHEHYFLECKFVSVYGHRNDLITF